jgi:hypothetical protein
MYGIPTIAGGTLAASAFIVARRPDAQKLIDKITPYQGWLGFGLFFWGAWILFNLLTHLGFYTEFPSILAIAVALAAVNLSVGFLLGFGLISKYALSRNAAAMARGERLRRRLIGYQIPLGLCAMAVGAVYCVMAV